MVFGLTRSFIFMGYDGLLFKRYLLNDPYNVVSLADLVGLSLWKLALFYVLLAGVGIQLLRSAAGRRLALLAAIGGLPVIIFGIFWQGGDMERYLPLYPFFFMAVVGAYETRPTLRALQWLIIACSVIVIVVNGSAHSRWQLSRYEVHLADRVRDVQLKLKPASVLIVVGDRLKQLARDFPLDKNIAGLRIAEVVTPGLATSAQWKTAFANEVLRTWQRGGDVWISTRCFAATPHADSTWVEGEDPRLKWTDVAAFFTTLETDNAGIDDGFVRLYETTDQRDRLGAMTLNAGN